MTCRHGTHPACPLAEYQPCVSTSTTAATPIAMHRKVTRTRPHCSGKTAGRRGAKVLRRKRFHTGKNVSVQEAFGVLIFAVVIVAAIVAVATIFFRGKAYGQIGRGGLSIRDEVPRREPTGAVAVRERDDEIRQMLVARNERRERRGEAPLDIEAELARLTAPAVDAGLEAEVRQLVIARNERRERRGQPPLDVEAEVARQLRELT